jgi:hypothetical protein
MAPDQLLSENRDPSESLILNRSVRERHVTAQELLNAVRVDALSPRLYHLLILSGAEVGVRKRRVARR